MAGGNKGKESYKDDRNRKKNFVWSPSDDEVMLEMLVDHVNKGNKTPDGKWREDVWEDVIPRFNAIKGTKITMDNITSRMKTWRKTYSALTNLLNHKGFSWDDTRKVVIADAAVWDAYVKDHDSARQYRYKACPIFDQLAVIIGGSASLLSPHPIAQNHASEDTPLLDGNPTLDENNEVDDNAVESSAGHGSSQGTPEQNKRICVVPFSGRRRKRLRHRDETADDLVAAVNKLTNAVETMTKLQEKIERRREERELQIEQQYQKMEKREQKQSSHDWYEALVEIPGLDSKLKFGAMELLEKKERREIFLKLDPRERRDWLEWMTSGSRQANAWNSRDVLT